MQTDPAILGSASLPMAGSPDQVMRKFGWHFTLPAAVVATTRRVKTETDEVIAKFPDCAIFSSADAASHGEA
jgi:hypothetical protein